MLIGTCIVSLAISGCGGGMIPHGGAQVVDSAGVRIVVSDPEAGGAVRWVLGAEPVLRIGALDGPPEMMFDGVRAAVRLEDGAIAIADGGTQDVRLFGPDGVILSRIGRRGGGPGEFRALWKLWTLPADTLVTYDAGAHRVSWFLRDGTLVRDQTLPLREVNRPIAELLGPFDDGSFAALLGEESQDPLAPRDGSVRDSSLLVLARPGAVSLDTLGWTPAVESYRVVLRGAGETAAMNAAPPAWPRTYVIAGPSRIFVAHSGRFDIHTTAPDGSGMLRIRLTGEPARVDQHEIDRWNAAYSSQRDRHIWEEVRARVVANAPTPEARPAHGELFADQDGNVWVARWRPPGETRPVFWWVFAPDGTLFATIQTPADARLLDAGAGYVLTLEHDEFAVEYVTVYHIAQP